MWCFGIEEIDIGVELVEFFGENCLGFVEKWLVFGVQFCLGVQ